jgi:hypothetical protein
MSSDIRWKQRFDNFDRAFVLLREIYERKLDSLSRLEKEGAIQRFEVAFERAWKNIKDYSFWPMGTCAGPSAGREYTKTRRERGVRWMPSGNGISAQRLRTE